MVQYTLNNLTDVIFWLGTNHQEHLQTVLTRLFVHPGKKPTTIHVYEPLLDADGTIANNMTFDDTRRNIFVIMSGEGHSEKEYSTFLARWDSFGEFSKISKQDIILYTTAFELPSRQYHHVQNMSGMIRITMDLSGKSLLFSPTEKHFVCLNREHRWQRQYLVEEIFKRNLDRHGMISYLAPPPETTMKDLYPLVIDDKNISIEQGFNLTNKIKNAAINVITETSFENNEGLIDAPGITEKTFKITLMCQLPLFVSSYKTVYHYRLLGFDPFDDIIDHNSYDLIEDPVERLEKVLSLLKHQICARPWSYFHHLREDSLDRFYHNLKVMDNQISLQPTILLWYNKLVEMNVL